MKIRRCPTRQDAASLRINRGTSDLALRAVIILLLVAAPPFFKGENPLGSEANLVTTL
jgi:hypothetical protein